MTVSKPVKTKSPSIPSYSLRDSFNDSRKLYTDFSHATFSRTEIASALGMSATSSSLTKRVFALAEYGLLEETNGKFRVSQQFHVLDSNAPNTSEFKRAAMRAVSSPNTFSEILTEFPNKFPEKTVIAARLEREKGFNAERAKEAATILEKSMQFANVLDSNNNILPIREAGQESEERQEAQPPSTNAQKAAPQGGLQPPPIIEGARRTEVPLMEGRVAIVFYPHDLSASEAQKIGKVLAALVD